jgi:hypothetical protein
VSFFEADSSDRAKREGKLERQNRFLLRRQSDFRVAADAAASAFSQLPEVEAVALFGSVAVALWKEVPRFGEYHRRHIELWYECKDVDLAVWLSRLDNLKRLQQARSQAMNSLFKEKGIGVAHHQAEVFILEPETSRYLGRLCVFGECPKQGKIECFVPGCGREAFLSQHPDFDFYSNALSSRILLFDRRHGIARRVSDVPSTGRV